MGGASLQSFSTRAEARGTKIFFQIGVFENNIFSVFGILLKFLAGIKVVVFTSACFRIDR